MAERDLPLWPTALRVARKEFRAFFASPAAYLFLGAFLAAVLFAFFWVDTFFARNIADARPLFRWLPLLLVFLVAALTMRSWSDERRAGTLESLLTAPVAPWSLVLGKFLAVLALVALALLLTLPLPLTVWLLGPLDWGPVAGGYLATLLLAAAYAAIGLSVSVRSDNAIIALIGTVAVCAVLHFLGTPALASLVGQPFGRWLELLGTGSRFEAITRGVLDLRDLAYFVSLAGIFLVLNVHALERLRWAGNPRRPQHRTRTALAVLAVANLAAINLWLLAVPWLRVDLTAERGFTLSQATREQLRDLREPLVIRGYFSARTHPYLAPLVPRLQDLLREYAAAAGPRAKVEIIDPTRDRAAEEEAASRYGVRPVPFQTADRHQAAVVSSYFDVVVSYGDQVEKLGFRDLIEVKGRSEDVLTVVLKNPEYAITRAVRKAVASYQAGGNAFQSLQKPVTLKAYFSPDDRLPQPLRQLRADLQAVLDEQRPRSGGKLQVSIADPDADGGKLARELREKYGLSPQIASLADPRPFWFTMLLDDGSELLQVPLPDKLDKPSLERTLQAAARRMAPGFLKTVGLVTPSAGAPAMPGMPPPGPSYHRLEQVLGDTARVRYTDLADGRVPDEVDLLLVAGPRELGDRQRFAIDQFLMRGGPVVLATSPFDVSMGSGITASPQKSGLEDWLAGFGVKLEEAMVVDPRSAALPVPVERTVAGVPLREIRFLKYPHFADLRGDALNAQSPITRSLQQLTLNWASPIALDAAKAKGLQVTELLRSSEGSRVSRARQLIPDARELPPLGFRTEGDAGPRLLAVALQGRFTSFYRGKDSPLAAAEGQPTSVVAQSPETARLVLVASNTFASDLAIDLASQGLETLYTKPVEFLQNTIDWALEDPALVDLRGRTQLARTLEALPEGAQRHWEIGNYLAALLALALVWAWRLWVRRMDARHAQRVLQAA
ncbi:MAG TPA: Gldg family protein [Ramlibacter sp.]|nr:Gldg family protein [Ramlibacter sp.]